MDVVKKRTLRDSVRLASLGAVAVAAVTAVCLLTHFDFAAAIPAFLLLVVLHSLAGDFRSSAVVSVVAATFLNYFFIEPLFSFRISNGEDVLSLLVFLATALIITKLVTRVRIEARSSSRQRERLALLYQLSQELLTLAPYDPPSKLLDALRRLFGVTAVCVFDAATARSYLIGSSDVGLCEKTRDAYIAGKDSDDAPNHISVRRIQVGAQTTGSIGFENLINSAETVGPLAVLTVGHLERTRAFRAASAAAAAAEAETYRSAMLDALAHEFKTPLATILTAAGGLGEAGPLTAEQLEMADTVESEAVRLGNLTSRLLRTVRLDREEIRPRMRLIDLSALISRIASHYMARLPDRRLILLSAQEKVDVLADPDLLRLTLNQLIENACKYSQPGSEVTIGIERDNDSVAVRITNSGSTIPAEEKDLIFDRFYRGTQARRSTSGTGLGLYVARKIALAHGGTLDLVANEPASDGVTFCLRIPSTKHEVRHAATTR